MPSVESFELDHNAVKAPYVRHCGVHKVGTDGVVNKFDIRFCQPNKQAMKPDTIHTLEHLLAFNIRKHSERTITLILSIFRQWDVKQDITLWSAVSRL